MRPIKLLLLIPHLGGGGAERVVALLARYLDPRRFEVHLGLIAQDFAGADALPAHVQVHRLERHRVRRAGLALVRLAHRIEPDIILGGMAHLNFLVLLLKPLLPRRTRVLVRQNTTASSAATSRRVRFAYRHLYPRADGILCQSQAMADDLADRFVIPRDRLVVLANPIEVPPHTAADAGNRNFFWPSAGWPRILAVGRLSPEKGIDLLLRAFAQILPQFPRAHLAVLGVGPEAAALKMLSRELLLEDTVTFAGHRQDLADCYAEATLFVQPSRYEGMPNALLEAGAAGLPIVATPSSGGVCDLLRSAPGTWLSAEITSDSLARTITDALDSLKPPGEAPMRFPHAFLTPFEAQTAIAAYAETMERFAAPRGPIHIAMLIPTIDAIGGAERQVILLARELAARGYRVTVVALSGSGGAALAELSQAGVEFLALEMRKAWIDPRGWLRYLAWSRRNRPNVLHTHLPHATWFGRWVRLLTPIRVQVDTIHTSHTGGRARQFGYRISGFLSSRVTCVSAAVAGAATKLSLRQNLSILPNGVPIPEVRPKRPAVPNPFRWIAVGRLSPVKDYPTLLRAFAQLSGEPSLAIAGAGPDETALRALAAQLGIAARVQFAGFQTEVTPLLEQADAFVLSSRWEGLPVSVLEAEAARLPIVATDGAGTREAMLPGETGLLVPVGDVGALARAMAAIMAMPHEERTAMGNRGRHFVEGTFSLAAIANRWESLYRDLLRMHPKPARWN